MQTLYNLKPEGTILNAASFDRLIFTLFSYLKKRTDKVKQIVINLEKVEEVNAYGGMGIFLLEQFFSTQKTYPAIKSQGSDSFNKIFSALEWVNKSKNRHPRVKENGNSLDLFMIIEDEEGIRKLLLFIINSLRPHLIQKFNYSEHKVNCIQNIMGELVQNVLDHSTIKTTPKGYIALRATKKEIEMAVMDLGLGIPTRLGESFNLKNDFQALKLAFNKRVSSKLTERRGIGLLEVKKMVTETQGYLSIRSNRAKITFAPKTYKPFGKNWLSLTSSYFPGTQAGVLLYNNKQ